MLEVLHLGTFIFILGRPGRVDPDGSHSALPGDCCFSLRTGLRVSTCRALRRRGAEGSAPVCSPPGTHRIHLPVRPPEADSALLPRAGQRPSCHGVWTPWAGGLRQRRGSSTSVPGSGTHVSGSWILRSLVTQAVMTKHRRQGCWKHKRRAVCGGSSPKKQVPSPPASLCPPPVCAHVALLIRWNPTPGLYVTLLTSQGPCPQMPSPGG